MRCICKNKTEPDTFNRWKKRNRSADWSQFSGTPEYGILKSDLIEGQLKMCCYCEEVISSENSHIEHLKPKGNPLYRKGMFLYENLMASCNKRDSCGNKKQGWYEPEMVSPLDENCNDRFIYTDDGRIIPFEEDDEWALNTIEKLGLNSPKLRNWRKTIINTLVSNERNVDLVYLKTLTESILKGHEEWTKGFYTVLLHIEKEYGISS